MNDESFDGDYVDCSFCNGDAARKCGDCEEWYCEDLVGSEVVAGDLG